MLDKIAIELKDKLRKQHIPPRILLDRLRLIDENSRRSGQYLDPNYLPFYYHLSGLIQPRNILHVGLDLGLPICCFLLGSKSTVGITCFQRRSSAFYSPRIALSNIKDVKGRKFPVEFHHGLIIDQEMQVKMSPGFDLVMITEKTSPDDLRESLDVTWEKLRLDGFIVVDHASEKERGEVFRNFCKGKDRPSADILTRYGISIVQK
jgi:hypothetical protein